MGGTLGGLWEGSGRVLGGALKALTALEAPGRRHLGGSIWEKAYGRRHLGEGIWEEASGRKHLRGGIWEDSGRDFGKALGWLWEGSAKGFGDLVALEAPGVAGRVSLRKVAPPRNGMQKFL